MDMTAAVAALSALAQPTRLDVFRLLMREAPNGIPAGKIAEKLAVPHNTLSTHLAILTRANLAKADRRGRSLLYAVDFDGFTALLGYLAKDCCNGHPDVCAPLIELLSPCCAPAAPKEKRAHARSTI